MPIRLSFIVAAFAGFIGFNNAYGQSGDQPPPESRSDQALPASVRVAPTETVIHTFFDNGTSLLEGYSPAAGLIRDSAGVLYGMNVYGGTGRGGVVYTLTLIPGTSQWRYKVIYNFANSGLGLLKGYQPSGPLVRDSAGALYGTASYGGSGAGGVVFRLAPLPGGQWQYTVLHNFANSGGGLNGGYKPAGGLVMDRNGLLYGTTQYGGPGRGGVVYRLSRTGSGFQVLHGFANSGTDIRNGYNPAAGLVVASNGIVYGTAAYGGVGAGGTIWRLLPPVGGEPWAFRLLHSFSNSGPGISGGYIPAFETLIMDSHGVLYGATSYGGSGAGGVFYKLSPPVGGAPWGYTVLRSFANSGSGLNNGYFPWGPLVMDQSGNMYGELYYGGTGQGGVVFKIAPGGAFTKLHDFSNSGAGFNFGYRPAAVVRDNATNTLYGLAFSGGTGNGGLAFKLK